MGKMMYSKYFCYLGSNPRKCLMRIFLLPNALRTRAKIKRRRKEGERKGRGKKITKAH